jgi:hypothetical protein
MLTVVANGEAIATRRSGITGGAIDSNGRARPIIWNHGPVEYRNIVPPSPVTPID